jgi:hypothetical protein
MNGYAYAADNPVNSSDPSGQCPIDKCGGSTPKPGGGGLTGQGPDPGDPGSSSGCDSQGSCGTIPPPPGSTNGNGAIRISQHVLAKTDNVTTQNLVASWAYVVAQRGNPTTIQGEDGDWYQVCLIDRKDCIAAGIEGIFGSDATTAFFGGDGMTTEDLLQGGILLTGASVDDVNNHGAAQFMSLAAANTLKGATVSDLSDVVDAACGGQSFTGDTNVVTASGKQVPISSLKQGEKVEAANTKTGKNESESVLAVLVHHDSDLYDLKLQTANGPSIVHTTADHLIWDETTHTWTEAAKIHTGDHLRTADGTIALAAGGTTPESSSGWMWDLTISNDHDFYVVANDTTVLVHNVQCRAADGKFARSDGTPSRVGSADEQTTLDQLELDGAPVIRGAVTVNIPGVGPRIYDGAVQIDGKWFGVETKGGTSPVTPRQQAADAWLNEEGNTAVSVGANSGYTLEGVFSSWVPDPVPVG